MHKYPNLITQYAETVTAELKKWERLDEGFDLGEKSWGVIIFKEIVERKKANKKAKSAPVIIRKPPFRRPPPQSESRTSP
uniref:Uncharacterized protein n=1 Tax=Cucumis sativus TaxID=3659 RepID=A0A0A0LT58_CUCSA